MKLLTVIESLGKGGAERVLVNTLPELKKLDIECEVAIIFKKDDLAKELEDFGIKVHKLNLSHKWNIFEAIRKLKNLNKENKYDLIHSHLFFAHFHTGLTFLFNKEIKKIVTFHNLGFDEYPANNFLKKLRKQLEELVVKTFDLKTAVSLAVKKHYSNHLNLNNINVINNSFPVEQFKAYKNKTTVNNLNKFTILTPGRLVEKKGHIFLIDAIKILNQKNYEINFMIVGDGPLENNIKQQIENINNINYQNAIPHNKLMELYNDVDLIVIPSIYEAFGLVVGEAMIMGTPIIATRVDGIVEMIEDKKEGLLVEPKNSMELANAIEKLYLDKNLRENLVINARNKIKSFDSQIIAQKWAELYKELLNEK